MSVTKAMLAMKRICEFAAGRESVCVCFGREERYFCEETRACLADVKRLLGEEKEPALRRQMEGAE